MAREFNDTEQDMSEGYGPPGSEVFMTKFGQSTRRVMSFCRPDVIMMFFW